MLPCPKCGKEEFIEVAGKGPAYKEVLARDASGKPTQTVDHHRVLYECLTCNLSLVEDPGIGLLVEAFNPDGEKIGTRFDEEAANKKTVADDRRRIALGGPTRPLGSTRRDMGGK